MAPLRKKKDLAKFLSSFENSEAEEENQDEHVPVFYVSNFRPQWRQIRPWPWPRKRRHDTQYNDIQHDDTQHNDTQYNDTQYNDTQQNDTKYNDIQYNGTQYSGLICDTHHVLWIRPQ